MDFQAELQPTDETAAFRLRPLTTGEVFDRTFSLYRQHFWLFTGISLVPALVALIGGIVKIMILRFTHLPPAAGPFSSTGLILFSIPWWIVTMAVYGSSQAASTLGVAGVYLGRPASMVSSYRESLKHWFRYPMLILVQLLSAGWLAILLYIAMAAAAGGVIALGLLSPTAGGALIIIASMIGALFSLYRYLRVSLAMPASVVEDLKIRAALKRSKALTPDRKMRIFLVFLLLGILYIIAGTAVLFLSSAALRGQTQMITAQVGTLLTSFIASLLLQPIGAISLCLFYFDERVRREGFDIEFMLLHAGAPAASSEAAEPSGDVAGV